MNPLLICHAPTLTRACPRSLKAAESEKRVIKRRTSSSGAGGESASSGQRSITPAFAAGKVRAASVEDALGRWIYAEKVPPSAFDHRSWPAVFAALKTARRQRSNHSPTDADRLNWHVYDFIVPH